MRRRVHMELLVSQANAETVRSALATDLAARQIFSRDVDVLISRSFDGSAVVVCEVRFATVAEADTFYNRVISRWTTGGIATRILAGSTVFRHDCPHDEVTSAACVTLSQAVK